MKGDENRNRPIFSEFFARFVMDEAVSAKELPGNGLNFTALPHKINTDADVNRYPCLCRISGLPEHGFAFHAAQPVQLST